LTSESANQLGLALQGQLDVLLSCSFVPTVIYTDPVAGFRKIVDQFPSVIIDKVGAQDNNAKWDIKIHRIKEVCQRV